MITTASSDHFRAASAMCMKTGMFLIARFQPPVGVVEEDQLAIPGVDHGAVGHDQPLPELDTEQHVREGTCARCGRDVNLTA